MLFIILLSTIAVSGFAHVRNYSNHTKRLNYTALALQRHVDIEKRSSGGSIKYSYLNSYDWPNLYDGCKSPPMDGYQSPIDINEFDVTLHTIVPHQLHWKDHITNLTMKFSGHHLEFHPPVNNGFHLTRDNVNYKLEQFHLHVPAEHTFKGIQYDAEMHFVHKSETGLIAVQGVWFKVNNQDSPIFTSALENGVATDNPSEKPITIPVIDFKEMLKEVLTNQPSAYSYTGTLTTPPCTADSGPVIWSISRDIQSISHAQLNILFRAQKGVRTNRPVTNFAPPILPAGTDAQQFIN